MTLSHQQEQERQAAAAAVVANTDASLSLINGCEYHC